MNNVKKIEGAFGVFRVVISVVIGYLLSLLIIFLISDNPLYVVRQFILGPFSSLRRFGDMVTLAAPFTFVGLCMCFMLAIDRINLVAEGIIMISGCMITAVAIAFADQPPVILLPMILIVGMLCGVTAAAIPAIINVKFKANIIVVSLMLNSILTYFAQYILKFKIRDSSAAIAASLKLPTQVLFPSIIRGTSIHAGIPIALVCTVIVAIIFYKTPFGFSLRTVGSNPVFARYVGINEARTLIFAQLLGGAIAGLGGTVEILGRYDRFMWTDPLGYGFDGLLVAVIARRNPALVPVGALLLAYIRTGSEIVTRSTDIPAEFVTIVQGIIILLIAAEMFLSGYKNKLVFKLAEKKLSNEQVI